MTPPTFSLVILRSQNIEQLKEFYHTLLDVPFEEHTDHGPRHYGAPLGTVYLELYPTKQRQKQLDGVGFTVSDLEATLANIDQKYFRGRREDEQFGKRAILNDPDGRLVYVREE